MRITNNILINNLKSNMRINIRNLERYQMQLATGQRINKPSDDPTGLVDVLRLSSRLRDNEQYKSNVDDALSWLTTTESALDSLVLNLNRAYELAVNGATGTLTYNDREALIAEMKRIREQVLDIANTAHGTRYVFGGTNTIQQPYDGTTWNDNTEIMYYEISKSVKIPVNLTAQQVFKSKATVAAGASSIKGAAISGTPGSALRDGAVINITAADNTGLTASAALDAGEAGVLTIGDASVGADSNNISLEIITNVTDTLAVTADGSKITIALANATAANNTPAAIEAALRALGTVDGVDVSDWTVTGDDTWNGGPPVSAFAAETIMSGGADADPDQTVVTFDDGTTSVSVIVDDLAASVAGTGPFSGLVFTAADVTVAAGAIKISGTDLLRTLDNLILHLASDYEALHGDMADIKANLDQVLTCRAEAGARMNHLEFTRERLLDQEVNFITLLSEKGDIDPVQVIMDLKNQENVYSSALAVGARIIMPTLMDFLR